MRLNTPLVSIIIPVFNAEKYLRATVQSALDQTWLNTEIIIIDDGSTDRSLSIAKEITDPRVRVLAQANSGAASARNLGLKAARGQLIQFLDADDLMQPDKISLQVRALPGNDHVGLCATVYFKDGEQADRIPVKHEWYQAGTSDPSDFLIKLYGGELIGKGFGGMIAPLAWLTPAAIIAKVGLWDESAGIDDDGEFFCRVVLASKGIIYLHDTAVYYRKYHTANSLSSRKDYLSRMSALRSAELKAAHLTAASNDPKSAIAISRIFAELAFSFYPRYYDLFLIAEKKSREAAPLLVHRPFNRGWKAVLSSMFGWKLVKRLEEIKRVTVKFLSDNKKL